MTDAPRIPEEQLTFATAGVSDQAVEATPGELLVGSRSGSGDGVEADPEGGGCFGGLKQSLTIHWTVQDR